MISIVVAYHNRKPQFQSTLESIQKQNYADLEVIAVDDRSVDEHRIEDLETQFDFLKVVRLNRSEFRNPCLSYNVGFNNALGDIVIIQSPECIHVGNILEITESKISENNYLSFATYSASHDLSQEISAHVRDDNSFDSAVQNLVLSSRQSGDFYLRDNVWFNHSVYSPRHYHFATAITKNNLERLNGFDERYALGIDYDDNEFKYRIDKMGLQTVSIDNPFAVHLWHDHSFSDVIINGFFYPPQRLMDINRNIFFNHTTKEDTWKAVHNEYYNCNRD